MTHHTRFDLQGKVAIVTGATGLLGEDIAIALAEAGATLILTDLHEPRLAKVLERLPSGPHSICPADLNSRASLQRLRDHALQHYGSIDVLVNNASYQESGEGAEKSSAIQFENYPLDQWQQVTSINLTSVFLSCQILGSQMLQGKYGSIINVVSHHGTTAPHKSILAHSAEQPYAKSPAFFATQGAIINFTRYLASYWGPHQVRVNCLATGEVEEDQSEAYKQNYTHFVPQNRMAKRNEFGGAVVFLASPASRYMTGAILPVEGGWSAI